MSRISEQALSVPQFKAIDLVPFVDSHLNVDAKDIIQNHKTFSVCHQWNEKTSDNKYEGPEANALGELLKKLQVDNYEALQVSNYTRKISLVRYYGVTTELARVGEAALKMVNMFNDLATKGLIRAVLAPFMLVELVGGKIVIVSYIAVDQPNEALVQSMYGSLSLKRAEYRRR